MLKKYLKQISMKSIRVQYLNPIYFVVIMLVFAKCAGDNKTIKVVNPAEAAKLIFENSNNPQFVILDVRTPEEFVSGHLAGAINIDYKADEFEANINKLDKKKTYLVYCRTGHRSAGAADIMKDNGFKSIKNLEGGIVKWINENNPVINEN